MSKRLCNLLKYNLISGKQFQSLGSTQNNLSGIISLLEWHHEGSFIAQ